MTHGGVLTHSLETSGVEDPKVELGEHGSQGIPSPKSILCSMVLSPPPRDEAMPLIVKASWGGGVVVLDLGR